MKRPTIAAAAVWLTLPWLAGCGGGLPPIPDAARAGRTEPAAAAIFAACVAAHGGQGAYARLHDVNIRFDSHWAALGPRLQPVLSDRGYRQGSEERYLPVGGGFVVGQLHTGPQGAKHVYREPGRIAISRRIHREGAGAAESFEPAHDPEADAAASIVTDAYAMFLWGPEFFVRRGAVFQKLAATGDVEGQPCDELATVLRPGLGLATEDRVVLWIDQRSHLLRRVQFTLNALESTQGAEVHVDLLDQRRLAGVMWPTRYAERIDRPANLPAHQWSLLGFDVNRGESAADLAAPGFARRAVAPAASLPAP